MGIGVVEAGEGDVAEVIAAYDWLAAPPGQPPPAWDPTAAAERFRALLANDRATSFVARESGELVGFVTATLDILSVRFGQRAWVEDLAVHPDRRSAGTGLALLDAAKDWARSRGASHLELDSGLGRTRAHEFYRRQTPVNESLSFGWRL